MFVSVVVDDEGVRAAMVRAEKWSARLVMAFARFSREEEEIERLAVLTSKRSRSLL